MGKTFVIGDIHGAYRAFEQCLNKASFDFEEDTLICLGDICDGWPDTKECVEKILQVKKLIYLLGNHDFLALNWMAYGEAEDVWTGQGGDATIASYDSGVPESHLNLFKSARSYYELNNRLFVHAGITPDKKPEQCGLNILLWDRTLAKLAFARYQAGDDTPITTYSEIYVGHTPISLPGPIQCCEVWLMDTGAGWDGVLSMMDIETNDMFISDPVPGLYPGVPGRSKK